MGSFSVKILTYNIFERPPLIRNNYSDYKDLRLSLFIEKVLPRFDIICLQEMFEYGSKRQKRLLAAAADLGFKYQHKSPAKSLFWDWSIDGGCLVLSKFPFAHIASETYDRGAAADRFAAKGFLYCQILLPDNQVLNLINTHLQASPHAKMGPDSNFAVIRHKQFLQICRFIKSKIAFSPEGSFPILLCGDLNVNARCELRGVNGLTEYESILNSLQEALPCFKVTDLLFEANHKTHPVTYGDGPDPNDPAKIYDTTLTAKTEVGSMQRLDYALWISLTKSPDIIKSGGLIHSASTPLSLAVAPSSTSLEPVVQESLVEKFIVQDKSPLTHLSDHYGISVLLELAK